MYDDENWVYDTYEDHKRNHAKLGIKLPEYDSSMRPHYTQGTDTFEIRLRLDFVLNALPFKDVHDVCTEAVLVIKSSGVYQLIVFGQHTEEVVLNPKNRDSYYNNSEGRSINLPQFDMNDLFSVLRKYQQQVDSIGGNDMLGVLEI